jgi:uncharacterized protein YqgC (DUF456 family)
VDPFVLLAVGLLVVGVVGSALPVVPGALASLAGVLLYWWSTGYADPSLPVLAGFVVVGLATLVVDYAGGALAAKAGGAATWVVAVAAVVGLLGLTVAGPLGVLVGTAGAVFALEYWRGGDGVDSGRRAAYATVGVLASALVQVTLTALMLVAFLVVLLV